MRAEEERLKFGFAVVVGVVVAHNGGQSYAAPVRDSCRPNESARTPAMRHIGPEHKNLVSLLRRNLPENCRNRRDPAPQ